MAKVQQHRKQKETKKGRDFSDNLPRGCTDETAAVEFMEYQRWGDNPTCVFCSSPRVYKMTDLKDPSKR